MDKLCKRLVAALTAAALAAGCLAVPAGRAAAASKGKVKVSASAKTLYLGWKPGKKSASITVKQGKKKVKAASLRFSVSNKKVAKVSAKGVVTARKAGKVTVAVKPKKKPEWKKTVKFTVKNYGMAFAKKKVYITLGGEEVTSEKLTLYGVNGKVTYTSSDRGVADVTAAGRVKAKRLGTAVITAKNKKGKKAVCTVITEHSGMAVHDPSVYRDPASGKYYSFGSHLVAAVSSNLIGFSPAANSGTNYSASSTLFTKPYTEEFAEAYAYTMPNGANQNAWAPDIIYNTAMGKYCMYISIVDGSKKCCIAMAASDKPDGPYQYKGMVVCSGMNTDGSDIDKTNVAEALGITAEQAGAGKYASLGDNSPDCIDATVFYDHEGKLWMVYGSFTTTGGVRLLKLDPATGLRGENYADSGDGTAGALSTDDPYYGKKIANSNGEGPYIQMVANPKSSTGYYYYLWTSVGNLQNYGGYNMRLVRAEKPEGPYFDPAGNPAVEDRQKYALGLRVMDNYQFSFMENAFVSQGGNSATDDGNGKTFIQFHTRTSASDSYTFRTHQTFMNEDGWLVTAPYEYNGETIADSYEKTAVAGDYEILYHRTSFAKTTTKNKDLLKSVRVALNGDGTVTGAYSGKWSLNGHDITIEIEGKTYKGVVLEQYEQNEAREKVMVFTASGSDNRSVWGSKMHRTDEEAAAYDAERLEVPEKAEKSFSLAEQGLFGSAITWSSDSAAISVEKGCASVVRGDADQTVTLTASVGKGSVKKEKTFQVAVPKDEWEVSAAVAGGRIALQKTYAGKAVTWSSSDSSVISPDGKVDQPEGGYAKVTLTADTGTEKQSFEVVVLPKKGGAVYEQDYSGMVSDPAIATVWKSVDKQNCLYVESDGTHDSFIKFAAGNTGTSQGARSQFGALAATGSSYIVSFDVALESGSLESTEFAITGTDVEFNEGNTNKGLQSGYILKLSAEAGSTDWSVNGSEGKFALPSAWVTVTAAVDRQAGKAAVVIEDQETVYYGGEVAVNGTGELDGLYLRWACKQGLVSVDNVGVYRTAS